MKIKKGDIMARTDDYAALYAAFINLQRDIDVRLTVNEEMKKTIRNETDETKKNSLTEKLTRSEKRLETQLEKYNDTKKKLERKENRLKPLEIQEGRKLGKRIADAGEKTEKTFLAEAKKPEVQQQKAPVGKDLLKEKLERKQQEDFASRLADARERLHIAEDHHKNALNDKVNMVNVRTKA